MEKSAAYWKLIIAYRLFFGLLIAIAIGWQLGKASGNPDFSIYNFFSFFTILSNLFLAIVLLSGVRTRKSRKFEYVRGAAALYMLTTGLVYWTLLSGHEAELQTTIPWVNTVLHTVAPLVALLDWWLVPPRRRLDWRKSLCWLAFPIAYVIYSLIRGSATGWYPYPFLDPSKTGGYIEVALYSLAIAVGMGVFAMLFTIPADQTADMKLLKRR